MEVASATAGNAPPAVTVRSTPPVTRVPVGDRTQQVPLPFRREERVVTDVPYSESLEAARRPPAHTGVGALPAPNVHAGPQAVQHLDAAQHASAAAAAQRSGGERPLRLEFRSPAVPSDHAPVPAPQASTTAGEARYLQEQGPHAARGTPSAAGAGYREADAYPPVTERARAAASGLAEHAAAAGSDVRRATGELGQIGRQHAAQATRDVSTLAGEVKQALTGDTLP